MTVEPNIDNERSVANKKRGRKTAFNDLSFPARMQVLRNDLTDTELRVGSYFLQNPEAAYLSITEVVSVSGIGHGSIIRFCKKAGCSGFQDFKVLLARELGKIGPDEAVANGDLISKYTEKIKKELDETRKLINRKIVRKAAEALNRAGEILVAGIAGSASTAIGFDYRLSRLGLKSMALCEGYTLSIRAANLRAGDALVAVSFSGATKDILAAAEIARENGATVISLTNFIYAPLVEIADISLFTTADRDPLSCEIFSNVAAGFVLDVVFSELLLVKKDARESIDRTFRAISDRRI